MFKRFITWLFKPQQPPLSWWRVIAWWEARRITFNLLVAIYSILCLMVFFWGILGSGILRPGEDAVEPLVFIALPVAINICYTLGWLVELPARLLFPSLSTTFGPWLMRLGLGLSAFLISLPAVYWCGYRIFQLAKVIN